MLCTPLPRIEIGERAKMPKRLPVVLSRDEVRAVLRQLQGTLWLIASLLYGAGFRLGECVELRVKDLDFDRHAVVVRRGKGQKDRTTPLPASLVEPLRAHLDDVRRRHEVDVRAGVGRVVLPEALDRKYPNAAEDGDGSSCFRRRGSAEILRMVHRPGFICTSPSSRRP